MLFFAKVAGIFFLWWFYSTAKKHNLPAFQWAGIGLVGYWLTWWIATLAIANPLLDTFAHSSGSILFAISQMPAIIAIAMAIFIRQKFLLSEVKTE